MEFIYTELDGTKHRVRIHNFTDSDHSIVRVMGGKNLNGFDRNYPDKKWVKVSDLTDVETGKPILFTKEYIKANTI